MVIVAQLVRALVCGTRGRRFEPGLSPKTPRKGVFLFDFIHFGIRFVKMKKTKPTVMFTLFKSPPKFPVVKPVNIRQIQNYLRKFEESIKASEEIQKEAMHS
ncbi:MAG: hypothetical protein RL407_739 [Bacteroidota bacterium]|jgi:hypothetical protein